MALRGPWAPYALTVSYLLLVAALIVLRAAIDSLDFLSIGWILVLAAVPLLPAVLPRLGPFLKSVSPYVQSFKIGAVSVDLHSVQSSAVNLEDIAGHLVSISSEAEPQFSGTDVDMLVAGLRRRRGSGDAPIVTVDLKDGRKWRLPNLYFLSRLLEPEPLVDQVIFTEQRGGTDGYLIGTSGADDLRQAIERVPGYTQALAEANLPSRAVEPGPSQQVADRFKAFRTALPEPTGRDDDPAHGWVTSARIRELLGASLGATAIEATDTLSEADKVVAVRSPYRFVPATTSGRVTGVVDSDPIARAVARSAVATS